MRRHPRSVKLDKRLIEGTSRLVSRPAVPAPVQMDEPMPTEPPSPGAHAWKDGCIVHQTVPQGAPERTIRLDGETVRAVLDSGSSITLIQPGVVRPQRGGKVTIPTTCVHGDTRNIPASRVTMAAGSGDC